MALAKIGTSTCLLNKLHTLTALDRVHRSNEDVSGLDDGNDSELEVRPGLVAPTCLRLLALCWHYFAACVCFRCTFSSTLAFNKRYLGIDEDRDEIL